MKFDTLCKNVNEIKEYKINRCKDLWKSMEIKIPKKYIYHVHVGEYILSSAN